MSVKLNFNRGNEGVWIDGTHPELVDTPFAGKDFRVRVKPITKTMFATAQKKNTRVRKGVETTDAVQANADLFVACVTEWEGFKNEEDGMEIPCDSKHKGLIVEHYMSFATGIVNAAMAAAEVSDDAMETEKGN